MFVPNAQPTTASAATEIEALITVPILSPAADSVLLIDLRNRPYLKQGNGRLYLSTADVTFWGQLLLLLFIVVAYNLAAEGGYNILRWAFILVASAFLLISFKAWCNLLLNQYRLRRQGHLVYGEILAAEGTNDGKYSYKLTLSYGFYTPDGRWLTREQVRYPLWMRRKPLPPTATPVAIYYMDASYMEVL